MRLLLLCAALLCATLSVESTARADTLTPRPELLVSPQWMAAHLDDPALRVVDLRDAGAYVDGHIPGAVHLPPGALFEVRDGVDGLLPPAAKVAAALRRAGIGADTTVVGYDEGGGLWAARLFWALDYLGQGHGRVLDGGWPLWVRQNRPTDTAMPRIVPGDFQPRPRPALLADLAWVRAHLNADGVTFVDARSPREYAGIVRYARHGGHIPGAVNLEWRRHLLPDGRMRPAAELAAAYRALGVSPAREIVVYCQVLARAAHTYFTLRWLGYPRVRGYDGSWAEWGNRDDTPIETAEPYAAPLAIGPGDPSEPAG